MATGKTAKWEALGLQATPAPEPWEAYLLPVSGFPIPVAERGRAIGFLEKLTRMAMSKWKLTPEFGIQVVQLHLEDGPARIAAHAREWIPQLGLGVWPDRPAPTIWTQEEFTELGIGERPRELMYQVLRITTTQAARESAPAAMLGLGTVLQILVPDSNEAFLERARDFLKRGITDPAYTAFPFYVPLIEAKGLRAAAAEHVDAWMCGCSVYIRESVEDSGILIASRHPLQPLLNRMA